MHAPARYRSSVTQAKRDTKAAAGKNSPDSKTPEAPEIPEDAQGEQAELSVEDETRRRFREALERKNASPGTHPGSQVDGGSHLKSSNGKRKREFRRKSGG
jgi:Family of unknown function (DUF5302)